MAPGLMQSHGLCPALGLPPHAPGLGVFVLPRGKQKVVKDSSARPVHHLLGLPQHSLTQPRLWRQANSLCFSPHPRSKESKHAYENTLEPEERVVTTAM